MIANRADLMDPPPGVFCSRHRTSGIVPSYSPPPGHGSSVGGSPTPRSRPLQLTSKLVMASNNIHFDFIKTELELALTLLKVARTEYSAGDRERGDVARDKA